MTSGAPLYLVSACGTAEEFVAAFRRYADRTGLFVPAQAPLPAGRKGRIAVTLKNGGVMIEGEAEILQSSNKPTVLYGRPGMTIKFVEPDDPSKIIIGELEKARLAMKVPAPSVPPRPANVPAEPRPVPPPVGGRIDATNALAECVVIGDPSTLKETASAPRTIGGEGSGKAKFVVPSIPSAPMGRTKSPSIPGEPTAVNTAPPQPPAPIAKEPSKPTPASIAKEPSKPTLAKPAPDPKLKMTSVGFPAIDKAPAVPVKPDNQLLNTNRGTEAPPNPTKVIAAENPLLSTQHGVGVGVDKPGTGPAAVVAAATPRPAGLGDDDATSIGEPPVKKITDPMPTTAPSKSAEQAATPQGLVPEPPKPEPPKSKPTHKATSIGFPALRTPFETQPVGVVAAPPAAAKDGEPAAPIVARPKPGMPAAPRGKTPTTPPLTPRHPTPVAPLPIVRPPAKASPAVPDEEEKTDLSAVPPAPKAALPAEAPVPQVDPFEKTDMGPTSRSGGMRASEIMAAIPTEDWTMTPDASGPTVLPPGSKPEGADAADAGAAEPAPIESKKPAKGPPTGNWTISLDPEAGWSEPQKIPASAPAAAPAPDKPATPAQVTRRTPKSGNPAMAVASDKALEVVEWEEKPTGIGEAKIEIDSTLMEPLKPMPALDDEPEDAGAPPPLAPPSRRTGTAPVRADVVPPPLGPMPPVATSSLPAASIMPSASASVPAQSMGFGGFGTNAGFPSPPASMHELGASGSVAALAEASPGASRKRMIIVIAAAALAVVAGFLLVIMLAGGKSKKSSAIGKGSALVEHGSAGSAERQVAVGVPDAAIDEGSAEGSAEEGPDQGPEQGSGAGSQVAVQPPDQGSNTTAPTNDGPCHVELTSVPAGADVYLAKDKLGTTPGTFDLPCGQPATLTLKKPKFLATEKTFTPSADKPKVVVRLGKPMLSLKVTSTPSGATITIAGKSAGVTPTTVKVPGFETSTITLSKPGYAKDTQRVTPKANGQAHHVVLKKGR